MLHDLGAVLHDLSVAAAVRTGFRGAAGEAIAVVRILRELNRVNRTWMTGTTGGEPQTPALRIATRC
jgi:hypothetical protein